MTEWLNWRAHTWPSLQFILQSAQNHGVKTKTRIGTQVPLLLHHSIIRRLIRGCSVSACVAFLCAELQVRSGALFHQHAEFVPLYVPQEKSRGCRQRPQGHSYLATTHKQWTPATSPPCVLGARSVGLHRGTEKGQFPWKYQIQENCLKLFVSWLYPFWCKDPWLRKWR